MTGCILQQISGEIRRLNKQQLLSSKVDHGELDELLSLPKVWLYRHKHMYIYTLDDKALLSFLMIFSISPLLSLANADEQLRRLLPQTSGLACQAEQCP